VGSHSHTWPKSYSSQDSQVPHGVGPPAQFVFVPARMRYAEAIEPSGRKRIADDPAPEAATDSEFETRIHPPSGVENVAWPSGKMCHG
jgi:hypothetical protein